MMTAAEYHGIAGAGYVWLTGDGVTSGQSVLKQGKNPRTAELLAGWMRIAVGPQFGDLGDKWRLMWNSESVESKKHPIMGDVLDEHLEIPAEDFGEPYHYCA